MDEKKFFEDSGVTVTNARFIVSDQTYAMSGITSVKSFRQDPSRTGPLVCGIVGLFLMLDGLPSGGGAGNGTVVLFGLILLAGAGIYWFGQKTEFSVLLTTASGEVKALDSRDGAFISRVVGALNDSIVHRG